MDLRGSTVVLTGASMGIGAESARALVSKDATVVGLARRVGPLRELEEELGERFMSRPCDVMSEADVSRVIGSLERVDVLVNNAGIGRFGPVDKQPLTDWTAQMETNLSGVFLCTRAVVPIMKAQNARVGFGGHIVNIASIAGHVGNANLSAYNATKFGLRGFSDAIMKELRDDGIKVSCLCPGSVATTFAGRGPKPHAMQPQDIAATLVHVLEAPDNYLISEVVMRPLRPRG